MNGLTVVVASLPAVCEVCGGERDVRISPPGKCLDAYVPCLHCVWGLPLVTVSKTEAAS